jgi:hypothetical protein
MNLVIDDAVEVTLANAKKETPEERRSVGAYYTQNFTLFANIYQAKSYSRATTSPSSSSSNKRHRRRLILKSIEARLRYRWDMKAADLGSDAIRLAISKREKDLEVLHAVARCSAPSPVTKASRR